MVVPSLLGQVHTDMLAYMQQCGGAFPSWYCGIASDPRDCLFVRHGVIEHPGAWIYRDCGIEAVARLIERYFHSLGCQGDCGGGGPDTRFVYAYKINSCTRQ